MIIGFTGLQGIIAMIAYAVASFIIAYVYIVRFLQPEEDTIETIDIFK